MSLCFFFFFKQKTAYEMRISDWSSDVCSSDLRWEQFSLDPDDLDIPARGPRDRRHARDQSTAADRCDERVDIGCVLEHLDRGRALAGDDARIVERVDEGVAALGLQFAGVRISGVEREIGRAHV